MRDDNDGRAELCLGLEQGIHHAVAVLGIQRACRLIAREQRRIVGQRAIPTLGRGSLGATS